MSVLNNMPWYSTVIIGIIFSGLIIYLVNKKVSINLGKISIEQQKQFVQQSEDNSIRLKIHAQIREYENYTGLIERIIYQAFENTYSDLNNEEKTVVKLFCNLVRRALEKQLMLDLVANHITDKTSEQLREYTKNKSLGYENRISNFLSAYNEIVLPDKNILDIVKNIDMNQLENIYFTIYSKSVEIAKQG